MHFGPDDYSSDEDGLSDDNDYYDFKARMKAKQKEANLNVDTEAEKKKWHLKTIFSAISHGKEDVLEELEKGLDPNIDLDQGWTPLLLASTVANEKIISTLLDKGVDVNQDRDSQTSLMLLCNIKTKDEATKEKIFSCVKLLLNKEANVNLVDKKRRTAIMFAANNGHLEIVKLLLPLVDKDAEDNQNWNVLFWAISGNSKETVKFLLDEGFDCNKTDNEKYTPAKLARFRGYFDILDLFPQDPLDEFNEYLYNNNIDFEEIFRNLKKNEKPQFFSDICAILKATRCINLMPLLRDRKIDLFEFLSLNEEKLKEIGVKLPFQRKRLLGGLYKFHRHQYQPKSIPFVRKDQLYTNIDVATTVLTCIKQTIAMQASLRFILENQKSDLNWEDPNEILFMINQTRQKIQRLKKVTELLVKKTEKWDSTLKPVDKITKKRWNIPWCNLWLSVGVISVVVFLKLKF